MRIKDRISHKFNRKQLSAVFAKATYWPCEIAKGFGRNEFNVLAAPVRAVTNEMAVFCLALIAMGALAAIAGPALVKPKRHKLAKLKLKLKLPRLKLSKPKLPGFKK
jgi:hypothetical protein